MVRRGHLGLIATPIAAGLSNLPRCDNLPPHTLVPLPSCYAWRGPVGSWFSKFWKAPGWWGQRDSWVGALLLPMPWALPCPCHTPTSFPICQHWQAFLPSQAGHWNTNWHWRYHSLSSTRAGRRHDSSDSSVKKCQEQSSGMPSSDCSTLALMSSLSAPALGALCGTGIIRMADEKNFSSRRNGEGREGTHSGTYGITWSRDGNHPAEKDQKPKKKGRKWY